MDLGLMIAFLSVLVGCTVLAGAFVGAWALGRRRGEREAEAARLRAAESEERLLRVERMLEGMALDVERMAEAQRFAARALAERGVDDRAPSALRPPR